jgi:uncharacterized protein YqgC (DUF456 family)
VLRERLDLDRLEGLEGQRPIALVMLDSLVVKAVMVAVVQILLPIVPVVVVVVLDQVVLEATVATEYRTNPWVPEVVEVAVVQVDPAVTTLVVMAEQRALVAVVLVAEEVR